MLPGGASLLLVIAVTVAQDTTTLPDFFGEPDSLLEPLGRLSRQYRGARASAPETPMNSPETPQDTSIQSTSRDTSSFPATTCKPPYEWVDTHGSHIPVGAIPGGKEGRVTLYIGRASHNGSIIPGKVNPTHGTCYYPWDLLEHGQSEYQILVTDDLTNFEWCPGSNGYIPNGAVQGGVSSDGEALYVGRMLYGNRLIPGKVQASYDSIYIPYGGSEHHYKSYEVLVCKSMAI